MGRVTDAIASERIGKVSVTEEFAIDGLDSSGRQIGPDPEEVKLVLNALNIDWLSPIQSEVINSDRRLMLVAGGERAGKSFISGLFGASRTPYGRLFWIVGPDYEQARPEFNYWAEHLLQLGAVTKRGISAPKVGKASLKTKTGQMIETKTADDVRKLASVAPDGILMTEAAQQSYESYLKCVGRVAERRGWVLASGTFEGSVGWYVDIYNEWINPNNVTGGIAYSMPTWSNTLIYPGGRRDPEILRLERVYERVEGWFEERFGATPVPPAYLVFREFRTPIHVSDKVKFDKSLPVYLAIDPSAGTNPYSVLACQFHKDNSYSADFADKIDYCHVIDEMYVTGKIGEEVIEMAKDKFWWDAVQGGAIDEEAPDERKRWLRYAKINLSHRKIPQLNGIRRLKSFLYYKKDKEGRFTKQPHLQLADHIRGLPYEFGVYKRDPPVKDDREAKDKPRSDQPNHSIKALWYLLIARYGEVKAGRTKRPAYTYKRRGIHAS